MISIVNKTTFTNPSALTSGSFNLATPSTPGNILVIAAAVLHGNSNVPPIAIQTDQGEIFLEGEGAFETGITSGFLYFLYTTKTATSIAFAARSGSAAAVGTYIVYEINDPAGLPNESHGIGNFCKFTLVSSFSFPGFNPISTPSICFLMSITPGSITNVSQAPTETDNLPPIVGEDATVVTYVYNNVTTSPLPVFTISPASAICVPSIVLSETIGAPVVTTTAVVSSVDPSNINQNVTFTATVSGPGGTGSPTGTITFNIDGTNVATLPASAVSTGVANAQFSISTLTLGIHPVFASYSGDTQYLASISPIIDQLVVQPCPFPFSVALQQLANRLYDPTSQFWSQAELILYMQEAFRTWNALTSYWRGDFTLQSQQGVVFYDITNQTTAPNTLRPLTITDQYLYTIMEYHLLEPAVGAGPWTGSLQFSIDDLLNAVQRRHNELLGITGCSVAHSLLPATPDRIYMLKTTLDIRRVAFIPESGLGLITSPMFEDDTWGIQSYQPDYTVQPAGVPFVYRKSTEPLLSFDADVPPMPGQYDLLTLEAGTPLTTTAPSTLLVPDDWTWVLKWGALADLLGRESNAKDLLRAKYCEGRYRQGISLLSAAAALLALRVDNIPLQIDAVKSADLYTPTWQGQTQASPNAALVAGLNLIALSPPPDSSAYSLTATVVENAPVPVNLNDCLLLTQDVYDVILDYAQHLAAFKMGGAEFLATEPLLQRFMSLAALYSSKLAEQGEFTKTLYAISQREATMNPRYSTDADPSSDGSQ